MVGTGLTFKDLGSSRKESNPVCRFDNPFGCRRAWAASGTPRHESSERMGPAHGIKKFKAPQFVEVGIVTGHPKNRNNGMSEVLGKCLGGSYDAPGLGSIVEGCGEKIGLLARDNGPRSRIG
jgi:hypothetical protein